MTILKMSGAALMYSAQIELAKDILRVGDKDAPLTICMAVRAEVIVDGRRVISFFLNPCSGTVVQMRLGLGAAFPCCAKEILEKFMRCLKRSLLSA